MNHFVRSATQNGGWTAETLISQDNSATNVVIEQRQPCRGRYVLLVRKFKVALGMEKKTSRPFLQKGDSFR